jgi:UDP-N-acetyl-D-mannosaminuronate dehydrogenase
LAGLKSQPITAEYDCIVIATAHQDYNGTEIAALGLPVVDSRRLVSPGPNIYQA